MFDRAAYRRPSDCLSPAMRGHRHGSGRAIVVRINDRGLTSDRVISPVPRARRRVQWNTPE